MQHRAEHVTSELAVVAAAVLKLFTPESSDWMQTKNLVI